VLGHNKIKCIENLSHLAHLEYLDVSYNQITECNVDELPLSLRFIEIQGNPCCDTPAKLTALKISLMKHLPNLIKIDDAPVLKEDRISCGAEV